MILPVPAIDIIDGRCVRLREGRFDAATHYDLDPIEVAERYRDAGCTHVHVVDLDGARAGRAVHLPLLKRIRDRSGLAVDYGGGLRSMTDLAAAIEAGADQVNIGSAAIRTPELLHQAIETFGAERVILAADVRDGRIATHGWQAQTPHDVTDVIAGFLPAGLRWVMCTDIARDGMLQGPAVELYRRLIQRFPDLSLIASGGVATLADLTALDELGLPRVVVGKALFEGRISLEEIVGHAR